MGNDPTDITPDTWEQAAEQAAAYIDVGRLDYKDHFGNYPPKQLVNVLDDCLEALCDEWWESEEYDFRGLMGKEDKSPLESWWGTIASMAMAASQLNGIKEYPSAGHVIEMLAHKQHDYGHNNILRFGIHGLMVRISDKIARIKNLLWRYDTAENEEWQKVSFYESVEDSFDDIVGYCIIGIMLTRGTFKLELEMDM